jgi:hypothetical protein
VLGCVEKLCGNGRQGLRGLCSHGNWGRVVGRGGGSYGVGCGEVLWGYAIGSVRGLAGNVGAGIGECAGGGVWDMR